MDAITARTGNLWLDIVMIIFHILAELDILSNA